MLTVCGQSEVILSRFYLIHARFPVISAQFSKTVARSDIFHSERVDESARKPYA